MISSEYVRTMTAYNAEMNVRLYGAAARLTDEERRRDRGAFFRSIHGTLNHLLWADRQWMSRFADWPANTTKLAESVSLIDDFDELRAARIANDARMVAWAATVEDAALSGELTWYSGGQQKEMTKPRALLIAHLFNHQTHHRGQVHAMLTAAGEQTGATDLPFILP